MAIYIVLEQPKNWDLVIPGVEVVAARDYLTRPQYSEARRAKVVNLCRGYAYQSVGYYVSLLAEARGHRPMPSVSTLQDLRMRPVLRLVSEEQEDLIRKALGPAPADPNAPREFRVYFGATREPGLERLARTLFNHFQAPLLNVAFAYAAGNWRLEGVRPLATADILPDERPFVAEAARKHFQRRGSAATTATPVARYDLAILYDPEEVHKPSDDRAVQKFVKAARSLGLAAWTIQKEDFASLGEYDALFLRETTAVNHHTYRFARRAEADGIVVLDTPQAIVRCTNKVFLAEAFERASIPTPRTRILHRDNADSVAAELGYPVVLKRPDSSFSVGVRKAHDEDEFRALVADFLSRSELVVAQRFVPSAFDWRVGVLDGRAIYACRYHMAPGHWQIQRTDGSRGGRFGQVDTLAVADAPAEAVRLAERSADLVGEGLFGVDIKEVDGRFLVMEVNDNPSIESGEEDRVLGDELYLVVMRWFLDRLERRGAKERS